ncbi:MAG: DUF3108 domain-containing protein [Alphaproteobacteria bacterium]|nr:MAG: DUF3108 domain-containing protein [Alphaproteobacteria bacterium]
MNSKKMMAQILLLTLGLLGGCGSFEKEKESLLSTEEKKDLVNAFDINKEQAELFKVDDASLAEKKSAPPVVEEVKATVDKKVSKKNGTKLPAPEKKELKPVEVQKEITTSLYPSDYPQILKDYDAKSGVIWEKFRPMFYKGEQSIMGISYLGVTAGYITISSKDVVTISDKMAYHYYARFKSKDAYRYFYWLDDTIETYIEKSTFLPVKYSLIQREKKQNVDDLQLFDFKKLKTYHWYKRVKPGSDKDEKIENYIPRYAQDSFSALQFVRGLPMIKGDKYDFPVITRGKPWLLKVEVMGEETISVNDQKVRAYRLKAETHFPGVLQKSGDINFWYAADEARRLLKFQAKVKIGSIYGELVEYTPGVLVK